MRLMADKIGMFWCGLMHDAAMWPIHDRYECRACGRRYPVPWARPKAGQSQTARQAVIPSLRSAWLPLLLMAAIVPTLPIRAADMLVSNSSPGAALALARYMSSEGETNVWQLETMDIDASLPKVAKTGRLKAIRRLLPFGAAEYQVLEIGGDPTVRQQVIARYLSEDARAAERPAGSMAISSVNYKFRYRGPVQVGTGIAYAFVLTPRKKREGLIKGELWLDSETGTAVRESGYLVKRPSIFVKRIEITRENSLRDGVIAERVTRLSVDTRLVGRADLVIEERPSSVSEGAPWTRAANR